MRTRPRARFATIGAALVALAVVVASCSSGDDSDSGSPSTTRDQGAGSTAAAFQPTGAEAAVAAYLQSQGNQYIGDCRNASLPQDRGSWCSTVVEDGDDQKTYEVGPVGEDPELILTVDRAGHATLTPGLAVDVDDGDVGDPRQLTLEQLLADSFVTSNLLLDLAANLGRGLADLPGFDASMISDGTDADADADDGGGGDGTGTGGGSQVVGNVTVLPDTDGQQGAAYPPPPPNITVDDPTVGVGGTVVFRGRACIPGETLAVFFDSTRIGTIAADANGEFVGSLTVPAGTKPGVHTITVRGVECELSVQITVIGDLAFTGSSNDTRTTVLVGASVLAVGLVLVVGSRRRRRSHVVGTG